MIKSVVYCIRNKTNDKYYVGSAAYFNGRWGSHRHALRKGTHYNAYLQRSWNKYGENNFEFIILEYVEDKSMMPERESHWIKILGSLIPAGYNMAIVTASGFEHNEISKAKMKARVKPRCTEEAKAKISKAHKGMKKPRPFPFTEEHKTKLRLAIVGMKFSESHKRNLGKPDKWPCPDGWKCKCQNCRDKINERARENAMKRFLAKAA